MFKSGIQYKTDKLTHHGYHRYYDMFLYPLINKDIILFEIGIDASRSLKMWNNMFKNGKIYGMDIEVNYVHEKGEIFKGDQSNAEDLDRIINIINKASIIIDDGSHKPEHQLFTFNYLFEKLLIFGGIYIIEDIETNYWTKGKLYNYDINAGYDAKNNVVKIFRDIVDIVNREFLLKEYLKKMEQSAINYENLKYISSITFGANCIIIKKMTIDEYKRYASREYRFSTNL
jgi:hypothetical protein